MKVILTIILGGGISLFLPDVFQMKLKLEAVEKLSEDIVELRYTTLK